MNRIGYIILIIIALSACNQQPSRLEESLTLAGENRAELERVLAHYSTDEKDSLKYRAAVFLIENMAGHISYGGNGTERYYDASDTVAEKYSGSHPDEIKEAFEPLVERFAAQPQIVPDLNAVNADYLIDNIDRAFADWQNGRWATHLNFNDFCEYLLPYKVVELQTLDHWREYLAKPEYGDLQYFNLTAANHSAYRACDRVNAALSKHLPKQSAETDTRPVRRISSLLNTLKTRDCDDYSITAAAVMRAKGIPVMIDFTPQWPTAQRGHSWCVVLDNSGKNVAFDGQTEQAKAVIGSPMAKAFRRTYAINPELLELNLSEENVPALFKSLCIKDVTGEYQYTVDISIPVDKSDSRYVYLCTFNNSAWNPIQYGKINGRNALFKDMGRDIVYLAAEMTATGLKPLTLPFHLTFQGDIKPIISDNNKKQTLTLYRKYPASYWATYEGHRILGSKIQAANKADFSDAVTVHVVDKFGTESDEIAINPNEKYRYWRHDFSPDIEGGMSELYFLSNGKNITRTGKPIGVSGKEKDEKIENLFDNDPVTRYTSPAPPDCWAGLDFGTPVSIDRILYAPRYDSNNISWGDDYELMYWEKGQWLSLGCKTAEHIYVTFDNCPSGALFLLRNHTRGKEERIFTYENGRQVFW